MIRDSVLLMLSLIHITKNDIDLDYNKFYGEARCKPMRYLPLIPRLQRSYASEASDPLIGWSTAGVMGCPVCIDDTRIFHLQNDRKSCYFDCNRQFLPQDYPYRRNKKAFTKKRVEKKDLCKQSRPRRNNLTTNDNRIQQSVFNHPGRASGETRIELQGQLVVGVALLGSYR
ncbi:hypothetical protein Sango_2324200 [Sesamum angolense]|uniref:Uncharacterized protein n=1 Tax=Sesamum angolense TaxID=2727404 RepID=A0AAE1WAM9_9LAMI|nr:hypothetical protein Sango_2324200 [Sesamum angolense]